MQISSTSATGTLEIPADLIFMTASAPKPQPAPIPTPVPVPAAVAVAPVVEAVPVVAPVASAPEALAPEPSVIADSSTVPALAVDALLSTVSDTPTPPVATEEAQKEAVQLELLADPVVPATERAAG
jgi:hypothetical protein